MVERLKVGVALGSGAARGLAHVGVLSVLKENNIELDFIAGTSAGAIVSAYYALNLDVKQLEEKLLKMTKKDYIKLVDLSTSKGLIKGNKIKKFLVDLYGDKSFSDTKIPLKIIATDLVTSKIEVINSGKIADAVRASISLPGIFVPVEVEGKVLVDGGIIDPTPIDIVKKMGADVVIGVDLPVARFDKENNITMAGVLLQSFEIMRKRVNNIDDEDNTLIIRPKFSNGFNVHQFYNKEYIEEGKRTAKEALPKIRKLIEPKES